ncbi:MAG: DUF3604 domain-containing protein [Halioglobus sp.]
MAWARPATTLAAALLALAACSPVEDPGLFPEFSASSAQAIPPKPNTAANPDRNLFWGDLHIHTGYSTDAYTMGVRTGPDDAYTFAKGGEIGHGAGYGIRLGRPLDFAAVTDHSEYLGVVRAIDPDLPLKARSLRQRLLNDGRLANTVMMLQTVVGFDLKNADTTDTAAISRAAWQQTIASAERHNSPGRFTAFIGYEWSSMPESRNLHRNVIYRSNVVPEQPFSSLDSQDPRDLWSALEAQRANNMDVFAIPHNGNVSDGLMYDSVAYDGSAMDIDYAQRRMRNEPLSEIFQVKGSSETHPLLSPTDEFAGFEIYDTLLSQSQAQSAAKGSYTRDALRLGLELSHGKGFNPYQFGVIGSSDGHNASAPVEENNYHGKLPLLDGSAALRMGKATYLPNSMPGGVRWSAQGLAAVWAQENTRASLFDAMRRKETFATSGPRITVRFFAGLDYPQDLLQQENWIGRASATGVPMGGTLHGSADTDTPRFILWAMRDPDGANLDRIQVVKGWVDKTGHAQEKIFNVAWSGQRLVNPEDGTLPSVGNTVDIATATYRNTIGSAQLQASWRDPEFNAGVEAFYYARVIEIPTPRWTTFDAKTLNIAAPEPSSLRERAVTSAIWYQPVKN